MISSELQELLDSGATLDELLATTRPGWEQRVRRRLALVRSFDADVYEIVMSGVEGAPPLEDVVARPWVEALPRRTGRYRLADGERRAELELERMGEGRDALEQVHRRLAEHYGQVDDDVEALHHEAAVDAPAALRRFDALFREADGRFDLGLCHDLVAAMTDQADALGPEACGRLDEYVRYVAARSLFVADWYRTATFVAPRKSVRQLERLLVDKGSRALSLWARGGMGKSMHLRWFIARRCVPRPAQIACARIDFDFLEARTAAQEPWLLLLEMASQLDPQLPVGVFGELLGQYGPNRRRLELRGGDESRQPIDERPEPLREDEVGDLRHRFVSALLRLPPEQRVLLALDTLEAALLPGGVQRGQTELEPLVRELALVHDAVPAVRLLLAGRYSLHARAPAIKKLLPHAPERELEGFGAAEIRRYLRESRGLDRPDLVEPILAASGGVPLKVAMIADLVEQNPALTAADYREVDFLYVVDRVLSRIAPPLRWLVRYGALARRLDRALVCDVLHPQVARAMRDPSADDPSGDPHAGAGLYPSVADVERPGPDELWEALEEYAGEAAWVDRAPGTIHAVQLHAEVAHPMRRLLARTQVARELHSAASEHFARRASEDVMAAGSWAAEAVYHRFQFEGPAAIAYWREWMRRLEGDPSARHVVAASVLGADYFDDGRAVAWSGGTRVISPASLIEARYQLALAAAHRPLAAGTSASPTDWLEAENAIADVEHLQAARGRPVVSRARIALVRAHLAFARGDVAAGEQARARAVRGRLTQIERAALALALADARAAAGEDAIADYEQALRAAERAPDADRRVPRVRERMAVQHAQRYRLDRAEELYEQLLADATDPRDRSRTALDLALLALLDGRPARALSLALAHLDEPAGPRARLLAGRAHLALGRADEALATVRAGDAAVPSGADAVRHTAERLELEAEACADMLAIAEASRRFEEAASLWVSAGDPPGVRRAWRRSAEVALRLGGDVTVARSALEQARRTSAPSSLREDVRLRLVDAEIAAVMGFDEVARVGLRENAAAAALGPPDVRAEIAIARLALGDPDAVPQLAAALAEVTPARARLVLLRPLARCGVIDAAPPAERMRLRATVPSPARDPEAFSGLEPEELAALTILDAELDRVVGEFRLAESALEAAAALMPAGGTVASFVVEAAVRLGARALARRVAERPPREPAASRPPAVVRTSQLMVEIVLGQAEGGPLDPDAANALRAAVAGLEKHEDGRLWVARASEALARDATARGEDPSEPARRAAAVYRALGDSVGEERALALAGASADDVGGEGIVTVELDPARRPFVASGGWQAAAAEGELGDAVAVLAGGAVSDAAIWGQLARALVERPEQLAGLRGMPSPPLVSSLRAEPPVLHALPWEHSLPGDRQLFRAPGPAGGEAATIRRVQLALGEQGEPGVAADGLLGPGTKAALERFQARSGLASTGMPDHPTLRALLTARPGRAPSAGALVPVFVVRPARRASKEARRGFGVSGSGPEQAYFGKGVELRVSESTWADELEAELHSSRPVVVHVSAGFLDARGTPALNLAPDRNEFHSDLLFPTVVERLVATSMPLPPLVVLDVPAPPAPEEAMVQLLLRNAFAAELSERGKLGPVLATGLVEPHDLGAFYGELRRAVEEGCSVGVLADRLRQRGGAPDTALFTASPDWLVPTPR